MGAQSAVIIDAVRSPMAVVGAGGIHSDLHAVELLAQVLRGLFDRNNIDPGVVDDVLIGCVSQADDQSASPGRLAWLAAGLPEHVPSTPMQRRGDSSQAVQFAVHDVVAGKYNVVVAGGTESSIGVSPGATRLSDDPTRTAHRHCLPGPVSEDIAAELVSAKWKLTRKQVDDYALRSHRRAGAVRAAGEFRDEIVPITVWTPEHRTMVCDDTTIRPDLTAEALAAFPPSGERPDLLERFPEIKWRVTAGNSAQPADGASVLLISGDRRARELGLRPRARFRSFAVAGDDQGTMHTAHIPATAKALERCGLSVGQIDHFEVCEAFATIPTVWQAEFDVNPDLLNPRGGAIALGRPLGASGARMLTTMLSALETTGGRYGLQTIGVAGGMATAFVVERL